MGQKKEVKNPFEYPRAVTEPTANLLPKPIQSHHHAQDRHSVGIGDLKKVQVHEDIIEKLKVDYESVRTAAVGKTLENGDKFQVRKPLDPDSHRLNHVDTEKSIIEGSEAESEIRHLKEVNEQINRQLNTLNNIYKQTLVNHYAEVKCLKDQLSQVQTSSQVLSSLQRLAEGLVECRGHLKLYQDFVADLTKIEGDIMILESERLVKLQMLTSHIQQATTRISISRIDRDIEQLKGLLKKSEEVKPEVGGIEVTKDSKYFQQLEKIRTENELLLSRAGELEAAILNLNQGETSKKFDISSQNDKSKVRSKEGNSHSASRAAILQIVRALSAIHKRAGNTITDEISRRENEELREQIRSLKKKIQELNSKLVSSLTELGQLRDENRNLKLKINQTIPSAETPKKASDYSLNLTQQITILKEELKKCIFSHSKTQSRFFSFLEIVKKNQITLTEAEIQSWIKEEFTSKQRITKVLQTAESQAKQTSI